MADLLDRADLIDALRELVRRAREQNITGVSIRVVGGAALRIAYFDRPNTADVDALVEPADQLIPLAEQIAIERGWSRDWLNDKAKMFVPSWGRQVKWIHLLSEPDVSISVASSEALLAMKLLASGSRPGRDTDDLVALLSLLGVSTVDAAEELFESFFPGDALPERTVLLLERIFSIGLPEPPSAPPPAQL